MRHPKSCLAPLTALLIMFAFIANASETVLYDPDLNQPSIYWTLNGQVIGWTLGKGNWAGSISDGIVCLRVDDMQCTNWTGVKIQQGVMPHNWSHTHWLRVNPTVNSTTNFKTRVKLRLCDVAFNLTAPSRPKNESWVNVGISLWMQRPGTNWNGADPQLEIGLKLFWLVNGEPYSGSPIHFKGDLGGDYHSLFDVYNEKTSDIGRWIEIELDTRSYISKALKQWNIEYAILRDVDVYIETIGGTGCLEIDYIQMDVYNEPQPPDITYCALIFAFLFIAAAFILVIKLIKRGVKHHHS
ncbi:MAG: hypothetical protein QXG09_01070 [Candidatus Bathyarchaeia archaeon]